MIGVSVNPQRSPLIPTRRTGPTMATTTPPTVDPSWPMPPEVLDLFAIIRAEVANTLALLDQRRGDQ